MIFSLFNFSIFSSVFSLFFPDALIKLDISLQVIYEDWNKKAKHKGFFLKYSLTTFSLSLFTIFILLLLFSFLSNFKQKRKSILLTLISLYQEKVCLPWNLAFKTCPWPDLITETSCFNVFGETILIPNVLLWTRVPVN